MATKQDYIDSAIKSILPILAIKAFLYISTVLSPVLIVWISIGLYIKILITLLFFDFCFAWLYKKLKDKATEVAEEEYEKDKSKGTLRMSFAEKMQDMMDKATEHRREIKK